MKPGLLNGKALVRVPLNVNRYIVFNNPKIFRTLKINSPRDSWIHPGWPGVNIIDDVVDESNEYIIPQRMKELLGKI